MSKPVACISDLLSDGDTIAKGSGNVFAENLPVSVHNDPTTGHACFPPSTMIATSGTVFVNNIPILRQGDSNVPHVCTLPPNPTDSGTVLVGRATVFAGE